MATLTGYDAIASFYCEEWSILFHPWAVAMIEKLVLPQISPGARVLDLCCGAGRVVKELSDRGYQTTGLDLSGRLLQFASHLAPASTFVHADATWFEFRPRFDCVVSLFDSLNHILEAEALDKVFANVFSALEPGGLFAFDMNLETAYRVNWQQSCAAAGNMHSFSVQGKFDPETGLAQTLVKATRFGRNWTNAEATIEQRYHPPDQILRSLEANGFEDLQFFSNPSADLHLDGDFGDGKGIFLARKPGLEVEHINTETALYNLRGEWDRLWHSSPDATPFSRPEWLLAWWQEFGNGDLRGLAVRYMGELAGLALLYRFEDRLLPVGISLSDRLDPILHPRWERAAAKRMAYELRDTRYYWPDLESESPLRRFLESQPGDPCMSVSLPQSWDEYLCSLSNGLRRNMRRYWEHLTEAGPTEFVEAGPGEIDSAINALLEYRIARWSGRPEGAAVTDQAALRFHRSAARAMHAAGHARFYVLRHQGRIAAVVYALVRGSRYYSYLGGFDPALSQYGPGTLILGKSIEDAMKRGAREWDFLRGEETYKRDWGARPRRLLTAGNGLSTLSTPNT